MSPAQRRETLGARVATWVAWSAALAVLLICAGNLRGMQLYARGAEPAELLEGIRQAELAQHRDGHPFVACGDRSSARTAAAGGASRPVADDPVFACLRDKLGWTAESPMTRTGVWIVVSVRDGAPAFAAFAVIDADGDGEFREYLATDRESARLLNDVGEH